MANTLPIVEIEGKKYFLNERLHELNPVDSPEPAIELRDRYIVKDKEGKIIAGGFMAEQAVEGALAKEGWKEAYRYRGERLELHKEVQEKLKADGCSIKEIQAGADFVIFAKCGKNEKLLKEAPE